MSDNKAEAENLLADVARVLATFLKDVSTNKATVKDAPFVSGLAGLNVAVAQVKATLYAAEQQRIANLIAIATEDADIFSTLLEGSPFIPVYAAIREGLGLS